MPASSASTRAPSRSVNFIYVTILPSRCHRYVVSISPLPRHYAYPLWSAAWCLRMRLFL
jgi:hypothetical protein